MKQKSLMSFFGKKDGADSKVTPQKPALKQAIAATPAKADKLKSRQNEQSSSSSPAAKEVRTPLPKAGSQSSGIVSATYTRSSDGASSAHETPPTSDPIDVDMLSDTDPTDTLQSSTVKSVCNP